MKFGEGWIKRLPSRNIFLLKCKPASENSVNFHEMAHWDDNNSKTTGFTCTFTKRGLPIKCGSQTQSF